MGVRGFVDWCKRCKGNGQIKRRDTGSNVEVIEVCPRCKGVCYEPAKVEIDNPKDEDIKP